MGNYSFHSPLGFCGFGLSWPSFYIWLFLLGLLLPLLCLKHWCYLEYQPQSTSVLARVFSRLAHSHLAFTGAGLFLDSRHPPPTRTFPPGAPRSVLPSFSTLLPPPHLSWDLLSGLTAESPALSQALAYSRHSECAQWFHVHGWTPDPPVANTHTEENTSLPVFSFSVNGIHHPISPPSSLSSHRPVAAFSASSPVHCVLFLSPLPPFSHKYHYPGPWRSCLSPGLWLYLCVCIPAFQSCPLKPILLHTVARWIWRKLQTLPRLQKDWNKGQGFSVLPVWGDSRKVLTLRRFVQFTTVGIKNPKGGFLRQLDKVSHLSYRINAWEYMGKTVVWGYHVCGKKAWRRIAALVRISCVALCRCPDLRYVFLFKMALQ